MLQVLCFRLLVLDPTDVYMPCMYKGMEPFTHPHIPVLEIGLTLALFCLHTGSRKYQPPLHLHNHGATAPGLHG